MLIEELFIPFQAGFIKFNFAIKITFKDHQIKKHICSKTRNSFMQISFLDLTVMVSSFVFVQGSPDFIEFDLKFQGKLLNLHFV